MYILYLGLAIILIGGLGFLIAAFKTSILWGTGLSIVLPHFHRLSDSVLARCQKSFFSYSSSGSLLYF